jgi:hypothetical protein
MYFKLTVLILSLLVELASTITIQSSSHPPESSETPLPATIPEPIVMENGEAKSDSPISNFTPTRNTAMPPTLPPTVPPTAKA